MSNSNLYIDKILRSCPLCKDEPGIYILTRQENNKRYAIIGSSKKVLTSLAYRLKEPGVINKLIQQYGFIYNDNLNGWVIKFISSNENNFDDVKEKYENFYDKNGYTCTTIY